MRSRIKGVIVLIFSLLTLCSSKCFAEDSLFQEARKLQREGRFDEAISAYRNYLTGATGEKNLTDDQFATYTDALVQLMNTFQSKGEPVECISVLQEVFMSAPLLQDEFLRDFHSVMGYALSRTEDMSKAEELTLKALTLPLHRATPERYFRDYAYAAAVFYSNPEYQDEVIEWCHEALIQAKACRNTSGQQWVMSMLGNLYKRNGDLNGALELYQQSLDDSRSRGDELGVLNSLSSFTDLFLYWDIPEYADMYASEAVKVERGMKQKNPMVSAQTYINKGRALFQLGKEDSVSFYIGQARELCDALPYNSGMVDIDLLSSDIICLERVTRQGTAANRAKAYHSLAQIYLENGQEKDAEIMLDSLQTILNHNDSPILVQHIDYKPILDHYLKKDNHIKVRQYVELMIHEQQAFKERGINSHRVEAIVELQTGNKLQELKIVKLRHTNQILWLLVCVIISLIIIAVVVTLLIYQNRRHKIQMRDADDRHAYLLQKLNQSNLEKEKIAQEVNEFLKDKDNRQELETLTPHVLKESGETKFRQCFELLYPLFLHRLREKVPSVTRREELLSMLIALHQDNKEIADLLAIAPRSVLMLRHRFRQKIGMNTDVSLENFIEDLLRI